MNLNRQNVALAAVAADGAAMPIVSGLIALTALVALALMPGAALGADAPAAAKEKPVKVEKVDGTSIKRVTLTAKAAERLGIETGTVKEKTIPHTRKLGGLVLPMPPTSQPTVPVSDQAADGKVWVSVVMSQGELNAVALDRPARILPLTRDGANAWIMAVPSKLPPVVDPKRSMLALHYVVQDANHGLQPLQRVLVKLEMSNHNVRRTVVATSAVFYQANGAASVYLNPAPLTYMREPVTVERIVGKKTVLTKGPSIGTTIVTVGAPLLYGAETLGK